MSQEIGNLVCYTQRIGTTKRDVNTMPATHRGLHDLQSRFIATFDTVHEVKASITAEEFMVIERVHTPGVQEVTSYQNGSLATAGLSQGDEASVQLQVNAANRAHKTRIVRCLCM